jgi:serine protease AprX
VRARYGLSRILAAMGVVAAGVGFSATAAGADVLSSTTSSTSCPSWAPAPGSLVGSPTSTVIVMAAPGVDVENLVACAGGQTTIGYTVINAVAAVVPQAELANLASTVGVSVTPDLTVSLQSTAVSTSPHAGSDVFRAETGATTLANAGDTGQGVNVAVLDTGISDLPDFSGRLVGGVDLTGENNPFQDDYGHGTFVAGLIAGDGVSSGGQYSGEAPGAGLVAIKVAGASGQTDLATVIEGVDWAVTNRQQYGIRVLNMSLGFQPVTSTVLNPLDQAVEAAWNAGIVVVTSAGNAGPFNGTVLSPGDDPMAITVGAIDDMGTPAIADDEMTDFSSVGPTNPDGWVKPDLVTSGRSVVSLADPGSTIWTEYPSARIGGANFVGSGTSFSAAITSGAAALVIAANPDLTPNQVKGRLLGTTNPGPVGNPFVDGHGELNAEAAATSGPLDYDQSTLGVAATAVGSTVSLSPSGPADTWNASLWNGSAWNGSAWNGSAWNGSAWNGSAWNGFVWNGSAWNGSAWNGSAWNGSAWNGSAWDGSAWNGSAWNGSAWNGSAWNGSAWN